MIKVLIVDDSASVRLFLQEILTADPGIEVVGSAGDGEEALEAVARLRPDVITMDVHLPRMNGLVATRRLMETFPTPIVIVSASLDAEEVATTFHALQAGAVAAISLPAGPGYPEHATEVKNFVLTVKLMAEVKVVRRWSQFTRELTRPAPSLPVATPPPAQIRAVAIGASAGGPLVIQTILAGLPSKFPVPLLIVQHMAPGFVAGFVEWLNITSRLPVRLASHGEPLLPGHAYVAPDGCHLEVMAGNRVNLHNVTPVNGLCPSVSVLFRSVAMVYDKEAVGVLLTGMGSDGARELHIMRELGAVTIIQDQESSVIYGMPGEALKLKAAGHILPPAGIIALLQRLIMERTA
ncbi:MAG: chemotaxis-specific protein-glutamate methyltransferase CheB [Geobacter sp.]|nr:chemotaxis-specific protein-glutamate methyltransferase CheB [Geobacter sp.]